MTLQQVNCLRPGQLFRMDVHLSSRGLDGPAVLRVVHNGGHDYLVVKIVNPTTACGPDFGYDAETLVERHAALLLCPKETL